MKIFALNLIYERNTTNKEEQKTNKYDFYSHFFFFNFCIPFLFVLLREKERLLSTAVHQMRETVGYAFTGYKSRVNLFILFLFRCRKTSGYKSSTKKTQRAKKKAKREWNEMNWNKFLVSTVDTLAVADVLIRPNRKENGMKEETKFFRFHRWR